MGFLFYYLLILLQDQLAFDQNFKSFYLILSVAIAACFYIFVSYLIKAFQLEDIKLKY
ncbi:MAG: murein biosynthesis integral membrane protein MurJ, partial [Proteobacteria bacterium]|jgi:putative peptidoglycan lipid II flippase|nr:murein biosynthesis integral membrane protein MurJ [Pseudomonadota bacterium]